MRLNLNKKKFGFFWENAERVTNRVTTIGDNIYIRSWENDEQQTDSNSKKQRKRQAAREYIHGMLINRHAEANPQENKTPTNPKKNE